MESSIAHDIKNKVRTKDVCIKEVSPFGKMLLVEPLCRGLQRCGYIYPTNIQAAAIPVGKSGLDLLIQAKSGTGKTLIFASIILETYRKNLREPQSLIVVPTRELAVQIETTINELGHFCSNFLCVSVIGGMAINADRKRLQGVKCIVGTPGRLIHLISNNILNTTAINLLVLDEADRLYSGNFQNDINHLLKILPAQRQTIACSATFCNDLDKELAKTMRNPLLISTEERATVLIGIKQYTYEIPEEKTSILEMESKLDGLRYIFGCLTFNQCVIFAGSQSRAESYRNYLEKDGWPCELISGAQDQQTRLTKFQRFKQYKTRILLTTDLMSRGIDSEHVNLVINLELPNDIVTYLHRIGRAGRFGSHGIAISFIASEKDAQNFKTFCVEVPQEMKIMKFPKKLVNNETHDFWDFSDINKEYEVLGLYGSKATLINANESIQSASIDQIELDEDNKENKPVNANESIPNASNDQIQLDEDNKENKSMNAIIPDSISSSIDTKNFQIDSKESAFNIIDSIIVQMEDDNLKINNNEASDTLQYSLQLPSSNTIDDASSITADSLHSSQLEISQPECMLTTTIPNLLELLIDKKQDEPIKDMSKAECKLNFVEQYSKTVLNIIQSEADEQSEEVELTMKKLNDYKSLLVDDSVDANSANIDPFSYYENFKCANTKDSVVLSCQQSDTNDDNSKATFVLSVDTPSYVQDSIEELNMSNSDDIIEAKHFPSVANDNVLKKDSQRNLEATLGTVINIPPGIAVLAEPENSSSATDNEGNELQQIDNGNFSSETDENNESSGFIGSTTSPSSGIETSQIDYVSDSSIYNSYEDDDDDPFSIDYSLRFECDEEEEWFDDDDDDDDDIEDGDFDSEEDDTYEESDNSCDHLGEDYQKWVNLYHNQVNFINYNLLMARYINNES